MARAILTDEQWDLLAPFFPEEKPSPKGGRPRVENRRALTGIMFVLRTGMAWEDLPKEMGCGSGMTCWRRLRDWQADGTWNLLHKSLLSLLRSEDKLDLSRAVIDTTSVRAVFAGRIRVPTRQIGPKPARSIMC